MCVDGLFTEALFNEPKQTLKELYSRLVFNILCGNTDDHAKNHAAFWDGKKLSLTPAYDICPQARTGNEASQGMLIFRNSNLSQIKLCFDSAEQYFLTKDEAKDVYIKQRQLIEDNWDLVCKEAGLSDLDKKLLWQRQFLNPFAFHSLYH